MNARDLFSTVRTEGGLLPAALLQRIVRDDGELPGLHPDTYHLAAGERLHETVSRAWNRLCGAWTSFRAAAAKLSEQDAGTTLTRERWLLILFQELGYGRLLGARAVTLEDKTYPISHFWHHSPLHLVSFRVDLDQRTAGLHGAARTSPHSLVQEFLNRSPEHLWGFVSNGLRLRILRDKASLTRQAFVEFDLEGMMDGEVYTDFVLLWLLCHQSRIEAEKPEDCWLERWARTAQEEGTRALDRLRRGVEHAIEALGKGFLAHPANSELRKKLRTGDLSTQDYYRQLLRLVYRLLFLFVAEDRGLLLDPAADLSARECYTRFYSTARLRHLSARRHGTKHADLYRGLHIVMERLGSDDGCPPLSLPPLGSFLWSFSAIPDLARCDIANHDFLGAIRALAFTREDRMLRPVDYKNLGSEELGSVYESLLELHPELCVDAPTFALDTASGNQRKTTGSYYTPTSLVQCLLDSALEPVLDEAARQPNAEAAILALKVCDPACGSGHFLIAAAHRMAKRLAAIRTGDDEPSPEATRSALRAVISHCIYGVDVNPMAVELCKVSLWLEAFEPGKPLTFLEHHIQCGNSLLGATPALLAQGIPDAAFEPIEGDEKSVVSALRKRHKAERQGLMSFSFIAEAGAAYGSLTESMSSLNAIDDTPITEVHRKEERYARLARSPEYRQARLAADAWCAAFVWKKTKTAPPPVTQDIFCRLLTEPEQVPEATCEEIARLAEQYNFLHWHLAFPDVFRVPAEDEAPENEQTGWSGGFDVVLGNPPWERIKLQEKEWFATYRPDIAAASNAAARRHLINALSAEAPTLYAAFLEARRQAEGESHLVRASGRYPLCGRGDVNTYTIFAETNRIVIAPTGRVGCIVPSGIATDDTTKYFFQDLMQTRSLASLYDFENREGIFSEVHRSYKFCLLTLTGAQRPALHGAEFVFFAHRVEDLHDEQRRFTLAAEDLALLNPNTRTCPVFRCKHDAELTKAIYRRVPVLIKEGSPEENPWGIRFSTMFHMSNDSSLFRTREQLEAQGWALEGNVFRRGNDVYLPLYEAKMLHHFDHRWATYDGSDTRDLTSTEKDNPETLALPRYWVPTDEVATRLTDKWRHSWLLGWRNITNTTNERTVIASVLPRVGVGHSSPLMFSCAGSPALTASLQANLSAIAFDFIARQKIGGTNLTYGYLNQFPVFPPTTYSYPTLWYLGEPLFTWLLPRVLELTYTAWDLAPFARDCGYDGPPFRWDEERRFLLRCELDAAYFHLYGIARDDVAYVIETFPIVKRKDEAQHGEYRTKRVILEMYDAMQRAIDVGEPYQSRLDPQPGPPANGLPSWRPGSPRPGNWPPHIHAPRSEKQG
jgi:Eco57I restriction-modification methylase